MKPATFIITSTVRAGVRLSCLGHWGNLPFPSIAAAESEARLLGGAGATVERGRGR